MSAEAQRRAFEPFFTTKHAARGTGLGLSTTYAIVRRTGGFVSLRSEPGQGTSVEILLPVSAARPAVEVERARSEAPAGPVGRATVLLVEDEPLVRMAISHYLTQGGYDVLEATNGAAALTMCQTHTGRIDLLLTDMVLPELNGRELVRQAVQLRPALTVLYMSAHSQEWLLCEGRLEPGRTSLQKPFGEELLLDTVRRALAGAAGAYRGRAPEPDK